MPLVALGPSRERLDLTLFDDPEWDALRGSGMPLRCQGCGGPMHTLAVPLTNPLPGETRELRLFRHNPGWAMRCRELGGDDSPAHDRLKNRLATGARSVGWTAEMEVQPTPDCRADVVATSPAGTTFALEAQLAGLNTADATRRHTNYEREFGRCTWTHTRAREWSHQIPSLQIDTQDHGTVIGGVLRNQSGLELAPPTPLTHVIGEVLTNRLRYLHLDGWGSYVLMSSLAAGGQPVKRPRSRQVTGEHIRRYCARFEQLGDAGRAMLSCGFASLDEFHEAWEEAHLGMAAAERLTDRDIDALSLAYQHPMLKDRMTIADPLGSFNAHWN